MGKYKKLYGTLLLGLIAIIILLTAVFSYSRSIEESYKEENINSLKELSNQGALMLHNEIKNKQNLLAELSHDVSRIFVNDPQAAAAYLEEAAERNSFKRIGVALTDGRAYTTDGVELNISEREYFSKAILSGTRLFHVIWMIIRMAAGSQFMRYRFLKMEAIRGLEFCSLLTAWIHLEKLLKYRFLAVLDILMWYRKMVML